MADTIKSMTGRSTKFEWDPITSADNVVLYSLGGKPMNLLMVEDAAMLLGHMEGSMPDYRKHIPNLRTMKMEEDDVIICGFGKSGTNWLWEMIQMLQKGKAEYHENMKITTMMEFTPVEELESLPKPRLLNTHFSYHCLPTDAINKKCKIIFIHRNPKDVAVSMLPFLKANQIIDQEVEWGEFFDNYIKCDLNTSLFNWFYYTQSWYEVLKEAPENIYSIAYEDLKEDTVGELTKLAKFWDIKEDITLFGNIAEKCSFQNLKEASKTKPFIVKTGKKTDHLFRKGVVGDWKNYFTVAQNERFDAAMMNRMKGIDLKFRYNL